MYIYICALCTGHCTVNALQKYQYLHCNYCTLHKCVHIHLYIVNVHVHHSACTSTYSSTVHVHVVMYMYFTWCIALISILVGWNLTEPLLRLALLYTIYYTCTLYVWLEYKSTNNMNSTFSRTCTCIHHVHNYTHSTYMYTTHVYVYIYMYIYMYMYTYTKEHV